MYNTDVYLSPEVTRFKLKKFCWYFNDALLYFSYVNSNKQFLKLLNIVQYFTCRDWMIENSNVKELMSKLSSADKKVLIITPKLRDSETLSMMSRGI